MHVVVRCYICRYSEALTGVKWFYRPIFVTLLCAKVIIKVASWQPHPNAVLARDCIVCMVVSVSGYSIRREA